MNLFDRGIFFTHFLSLFPLLLLEGFHRFLANQAAISVIEEKGEGFENGKNQFSAAFV